MGGVDVIDEVATSRGPSRQGEEEESVIPTPRLMGRGRLYLRVFARGARALGAVVGAISLVAQARLELICIPLVVRHWWVDE